MHQQFLPFRVDPPTGEHLGLTVTERQSAQVCAETLDPPTSRYPIIQNVPRLAPKEIQIRFLLSKYWVLGSSVMKLPNTAKVHKGL